MSEETPHVPYSTVALEVFNRARAYAEQFGHDEIEPHHLLLGVLSHEGIVVKRVMHTLQIRLDKAVQRFEGRWGDRTNPSVMVRLHCSDATWKVLMTARDEAYNRERDEINATDILFALVYHSKHSPEEMEVVLDLLTHAHKDGTVLTASQVVEVTLDAVTRHYQPVYGARH